MKKAVTKFKELSILKKFLLLLFISFVITVLIAYNWIINSIYHYLVETLGIPYLSSISGLPIDTIDWLLITLPFYLKIIPIFIFLPIVVIIIIKKKRTKSSVL